MRRAQTLGLLLAGLLAPAPLPAAAAPTATPAARSDLCAGLRMEAAALKQAQAWVNERLARSGRDSPSATERRQLAHCLAKVGVLFLAIGDANQASAAHRQALSVQLSLKPMAADAVAHQRLMLAGALYNQGDDAGAMRELDQADALFRSQPPTPEQASNRAMVLSQRAMVFERRGESGRALDQRQQALTLQERAGDGDGQIRTLETMAMGLISLGQIGAAQALIPRLRQLAPQRTFLVDTLLTSLNQGATASDLTDPAALRAAVDQARKAGLQTITAIQLESLATALGNQGDLQGALQAQREALTIHRAMGSPRRQAGVLVAIGANQHRLGQFQPALEAYSAALALARASGDRALELKSLQALSSLETDLGSLDAGARHGERALGLARIQEDRLSELLILVGLADLERQRRDPVRAWERAEEAVAVADRLATPLLQVTALTALIRAGTVPAPGADAPNREEAATQERLNRALSAARRIEQLGLSLRKPLLVALGNRYRARVLVAMGQTRLALDPARAAVEPLRGGQDPLALAASLDQLGRIALALGQPELARSSQREALSLWQAMGQQPERAESLHQLSRSSHALGDDDRALAEAQQAVTLIEGLRSGLQARSLRQSYFSRVQEPYDWWIELLMQRHRLQPQAGWDRQALDVNERSRARNLVELLRQSDTEIRRGVPPALLRQQRDLSLRERLLEAQRQRLLGADDEGLASGDPASSQRLRTTVDQELAALEERRSRLEQQLRQQDPEAQSLLSGTDLISASRLGVLLGAGDQTLLLSFHLGPRLSVLWWVDQQGVRSALLPERHTLEQAVLRYRKALMRPDQRQEEERLARDLGRVLLGPVAEALQGRRLVIIPDGAMHYLPFAALIAPDSGRRLVLDHELISLPSASTLAALRQRQRRQPAPGSLRQRPAIVFADPVFEVSDNRISALHTSPIQERAGAAPSDTISRSASALGIEWRRLPGTALEASALAHLLKREHLISHLGLDASKTQLHDLTLQRFGLLHFATHGLANARQPELSAVVLSLLDERGQPREGYLRLKDLYNLPLAADLVVVSACQSGLGGQIRGEGMVGLTRGFLHAGSRRVITSLWNVEDGATATLMGAFYQALLVQGLPPAAALRQAQRTMLEQHQAPPYDWAAFVLHGDWR